MEVDKFRSIAQTVEKDKGHPADEVKSSGRLKAKQRWNDLKSQIDMHGIPQLQRDIHVIKTVVWVLVLLTMLGVCVWQTYLVIVLFASRPTSTSFELIYGRELDFPAVTLCNLNPFRTSRISRIPGGPAKIFFDSIINQDTGNLGPKHKGSTFSWNDVNFDSHRSDFDTKQEFYAMFMSLRTQDQEGVGYSIEDMLLDCSWQGKTCSPSNFTRSPHPFFGNCFTFNQPDENGSVVTSNSPGPLAGLSLTLNIAQDDYFHQVAESAGIKVVVHHQDTMPFPEETGILVSPGTQTQIGVKMTVIQRAEAPYGSCQNFSTAEAKVLDAYTEQLPGVNYTSEGCERTCLQKHIARECNCKYAIYVYTGSTFRNSSVPSAEFCDVKNVTTMRCIQKLEKRVHNGDIACNQLCPTRCSETVFVPTVTSSVWPALVKENDVMNLVNTVNKNLSKRLQNNTRAENREHIHRNFLKIDVFFRDLRYEYIETSAAYTTEEMISDLGGTMELYLGISIVTFVELLEFLADLFAICARKMSAKTSPRD